MAYSRFCILLLISLSIFLFSCDKKIKVIARNYKDGSPKEIRYFNNENDSKQKINITYVDGVGVLNVPASFYQELYYDNAVLQTRGQYLKGYSSGLWEYFNKNGSQQAKCYYKNGKTVDTVYCFDSIGRMQRHMIEIDTTKKLWNYYTYYPNGKLKEHTYIHITGDDSGFLYDGPDTAWFDNGNPIYKVKFKNDTLIGIAYTFSKNGDSLKYVTYRKGDIGFPYKQWLENGLILYGNYIDKSEKEVLWQWFDKSAKEIKREIQKKDNHSQFIPPS